MIGGESESESKFFRAVGWDAGRNCERERRRGVKEGEKGWWEGEKGGWWAVCGGVHIARRAVMSCRITLLVVWVHVWYPKVFASLKGTYIYDVIIGLRRGISSQSSRRWGRSLFHQPWYEPRWSPHCPASHLPLPRRRRLRLHSLRRRILLRFHWCARVCVCVLVRGILISLVRNSIGKYDFKNSTFSQWMASCL